MTQYAVQLGEHVSPLQVPVRNYSSHSGQAEAAGDALHLLCRHLLGLLNGLGDRRLDVTLEFLLFVRTQKLRIDVYFFDFLLTSKDYFDLAVGLGGLDQRVAQFFLNLLGFLAEVVELFPCLILSKAIVLRLVTRPVYPYPAARSLAYLPRVRFQRMRIRSRKVCSAALIGRRRVPGVSYQLTGTSLIV